ncbi:hypothetical protein ACIGXI_28855 [Kitasatospora aureofaciens]
MRRPTDQPADDLLAPPLPGPLHAGPTPEGGFAVRARLPLRVV